MRRLSGSGLAAVALILFIVGGLAVAARDQSVAAAPDADQLINLTTNPVSIENARLGSRFHASYQPQDKTVWMSTVGMVHDRNSNLVAGLRMGDNDAILPIAANPAFTAYLAKPTLRQGLTYSDLSGSLNNITLTLRTISPFQSSSAISDETAKMSIAPFLYQVVQVTNPSTATVSVSVLMALDGNLGYARLGDYDVLYFSDVVTGTVPLPGTRALAVKRGDAAFYEASGSVYSKFANGQDLSNYTTPGGAGGFQFNFTLAPGETAERMLIVAGYNSNAMMTDARVGRPLKFYYTQIFPNLDSVLTYATTDIAAKLAATTAFEDNLTNSSQNAKTRWVITQAFHSYLTDTWLLYDPVSGVTHFYVWEGYSWGRFLSTMDVAHEYGVFEGFEIPWVLKLELEEWADPTHVYSDSYGTFMPHDLGAELTVVPGQGYRDTMQVEESANYILLLYWYWKRTGDDTFVSGKMALVTSLMQSLLNRDGSGNGLADRSAGLTAYDQAQSLIYGEENLYIGIKEMAAAIAAKRMFTNFGMTAQATTANNFANVIRDTVHNTYADYGYLPISFINRHFTYDDSTVAILDGLLYLTLTGDMPEQVWYLRSDLSAAYERAYQEAIRPFGVSLEQNGGITWLSKIAVADIVSQKALTYASNSKGYEYNYLIRTTKGYAEDWTTTSGWLIYGLNYYPRGIVSWALIKDTAPFATPTPTPTRTQLPPGPGAISGTVLMQGRGAPPSAPQAVPVRVQLYEPGSTLATYIYSTTTDVNGRFVVPGEATPGIYAGVWDVSVKSAQNLRNRSGNVSITEPISLTLGTLKGGDGSDDNFVGAADLSILASSLLKAAGEPGYDERADFTGDGFVGASDLSILASNLFQIGPAALSAGEGGPQPQATPTVTFRASSASVALGQTVDVYVYLDFTGPAGAVLNSVTFRLEYDKNLLTLVASNCALSSFAEDVCRSDPSRVPAIIDYAGHANPGLGLRTFTLARFTFRAGQTLGSSQMTLAASPYRSACSPPADPNDPPDCTAGGARNGTVTIIVQPTKTPTPTICAGCPTFTPTPTPTPMNLCVNAGSATAYTDRQGKVWVADQKYQSGANTWGYNAGDSYSTAQAIAGTEDDPLYQSERYNTGGLNYSFVVANGAFKVDLRFAELYYTAKSKRIFGVSIEGTPVITNLDLVATAGALTAYNQVFTTTVGDGLLNVAFTPGTGSPKVNGLCITSLESGSPTATPTPTGAATGVSTATATAALSPTPTVTNTASATPTPTATPRDPNEPNGTYGTATTLEPGRDYLAYIDDRGDVDYYTFVVSRTNSYIWVSLTDLPADYDLYLHNADHTLADWSAYGGVSDEHILDYGIDARTGVYYLSVVGYNHAFNAGTPYRLRLEIHQATPTVTPTRTATATPTTPASATPSPSRTATVTATPPASPSRTMTPTPTRTNVPLDPFEPNDTYDQAHPIVAGVTYAGYVDTPGDNDIYALPVAMVGGQIVASLTNLPADYDLFLADAARTIVASSRYGGLANEYLVHPAVTTGTYYLIVVGYNHAFDADRPYRLQAVVVPPSSSVTMTPVIIEDTPTPTRTPTSTPLPGEDTATPTPTHTPDGSQWGVRVSLPVIIVDVGE